MMPNASTSRPHWHSTLAAPLTRTRRYFCCATAQRAWYSCACLHTPNGAKESWPTCLDHPLTAPKPSATPALSAAATPSSAPCLVYSFGIANQWEFDDSMADRGCEVHSFDPTGSTMSVHQAHKHPSGRVHFHGWGLSSDAPARCAKGKGNGARRFVGGTYGALTGPLYSLDRIRQKLGHVGRRISVLKIDCEGYV